MTIGIDASRAVKPKRTGTEEYSFQLINALLNLDTEHRFVLFSPEKSEAIKSSRNNYRWEIVPRGRLWSQLRLPAAVKKTKIDKLFVPSHVLPYLTKAPTAVTVHDVAYRYFPDSYSWTQKLYLELTTAHAVKRAIKIICPSQRTKNDLVKFYGADEEKVAVIPHGYNSVIYNQQPAARPCSEKYALYIGRIETKKNIINLLKAFARTTAQTNLRLYLIGGTGYGYENIMGYYNRMDNSARQKIKFLGHLPSEEVASYLKNAEMFLYPSLYEGFGLPLLEAFACGTPVISSNTGSCAEVAGEAAVLLAPDDIAGWANAIGDLYENRAMRQKYITTGFNRVKTYSWEMCAKQTLSVLAENK